MKVFFVNQKGFQSKYAKVLRSQRYVCCGMTLLVNIQLCWFIHLIPCGKKFWERSDLRFFAFCRNKCLGIWISDKFLSSTSYTGLVYNSSARCWLFHLCKSFVYNILLMSASCSLQNKVMVRRYFMSSVDFSKELRTSYAQKRTQKRSRKLKRKLVNRAQSLFLALGALVLPGGNF